MTGLFMNILNIYLNIQRVRSPDVMLAAPVGHLYLCTVSPAFCLARLPSRVLSASLAPPSGLARPQPSCEGSLLEILIFVLRPMCVAKLVIEAWMRLEKERVAMEREAVEWRREWWWREGEICFAPPMCARALPGWLVALCNERAPGTPWESYLVSLT